jgi:hypothetical protein
MAFYTISPYTIVSVGGDRPIGSIGIIGSGIQVSGITGVPYAIGITHPGAIQSLLPPAPFAMHMPMTLPTMMYASHHHHSGHVHPMHARSVIDSIVDRQVGRSRK